MVMPSCCASSDLNYIGYADFLAITPIVNRFRDLFVYLEWWDNKGSPSEKSCFDYGFEKIWP